jgi:hypothetical protein
LIFKYRKDIFDSIIEPLIETEQDGPGNTEAAGLGNSELYQKVIGKIGVALSYRDYKSHRYNMEKDGFLFKTKKGDKTFYSLTKLAKTGYQLGILGPDKNTERLRCLYQFLILCDCFYQGNQISEEELDRILSSVGATRKDLVRESHVRRNGTNFSETIYKPASTVSVRMMGLAGNHNSNSENSSYYYCKEEGVSLKQAKHLLISGIIDFPLFVGDFRNCETDLKNAIDRLRSVDIIRPIQSYLDQEPRFCVRDTIDGIPYQKIKYLIWEIHALESTYLNLEWEFRKLTEHEKEALRHLFGRIGSYKIFKDANNRRRASHKTLPILELKRLAESISTILDRKIKEFCKEYRHVINENYLFYDMVQKIIIRNSILKNMVGA